MDLSGTVVFWLNSYQFDLMVINVDKRINDIQ